MKSLRSFPSLFLLIFAVFALVGLPQASAQNVSNYSEQGGARWVVGGSLDVASGGEIDIESGGAFKIAGTAVTATAAEVNEYVLCLDIADGSADATYYLVAPHAGTISKIYTVIDGAVGTADITVTGKIGSTAITNGAVTIATASSAAGDVDSATPTAANTITAGAAMNFVVAGGGAGGSPRIHLVVVITR
jgi:hypothetical protein